MPAPGPLQRDLPHVHRDGTIKFRAVLGMARARRRIRRDIEASDILRTCDTCLVRRFDRVRDDMALVRTDIAHMRAFWSVANTPSIPMRAVRREHFGHVWFESEPVEETATEQKEAA